LVLKKHQRMRKNADFRRVYRAGKAVPGKHLVLVMKKNGVGVTRFGFSISKRVGKAVVRNRAKRIIREVCRQCLDEIKDGYDLVFIGRSSIKHCSYEEVKNDFLRIIKKAGLKK